VSKTAPLDSKLVPVLREAVLTVQMVLFRRLKEQDIQQDQVLSPQERNWLAGAVISSLYGTAPADSQVSDFARKHRKVIATELRSLHSYLEDMIPHITDSLRMQALCDHCEGTSSIPCLLLAKELGLLDEKRELPLPSAFMLSVRKLGTEQGLVEAMLPAAPQEK